jgi:hypothetical protein
MKIKSLDTIQHYILDVETLALSVDSVILAIALVKFNFNDIKNITKIDSVNFKLNIKRQINDHRIYESSTVAWWKKQDEQIKKEVFYPSNEDKDVIEIIDSINEFLDKNNYSEEDMLWKINNCFSSYDVYKNFCDFYKKDYLLKNYRIYDSMTLFSVLSGINYGISTYDFDVINIIINNTKYEQLHLMKYIPLHDCIRCAENIRRNIL